MLRLIADKWWNQMRSWWCGTPPVTLPASFWRKHTAQHTPQWFLTTALQVGLCRATKLKIILIINHMKEKCWRWLQALKKRRNDTTPSLFVANVLSVMMNESSALCWGKENKFTWLLFIHFLIVYLLKINPASPRQSRAGSRCPARTFGLYVSRLGLAVVRFPFLPSRGRCRHRQ